jgi:hypothetical protein
MKCIRICYLTLATLAVNLVGAELQKIHNRTAENASVGTLPSKFVVVDRSHAARQDTPPPESPPGSPPSWEDEIWQTAHYRGAKLLAAISASDEKQRNILHWPYIQSTWDGGLHKELEERGYMNSDELHRNADIFCDFGGSFHEIITEFMTMSIDPKSAESGGPNHWFHVEHQNGPAVLNRNADESIPEPKDQVYYIGGKEYKARVSLRRQFLVRWSQATRAYT